MKNKDIDNILKENLKDIINFSEYENSEIKCKKQAFKIYNEEQKKLLQSHILLNKHKFNLSVIDREIITIYSKTYTKDIIDKLIYQIGKIIYLSYKKNFTKIKNPKNNQYYTSDAGWGCMIRCGQMLLSRGIYKYYKQMKYDSFNALKETSKFFLDNPLDINELPEPFIHMMSTYLKSIDVINNNKDKTLISCYSPFSLKSICLNGIICDKSAGEWFSDVNMCYLFQLISEKYNLFNNLKILSFQSCVVKEDIIKSCFSTEKTFTNENEFIVYDGNKYYFKNMGIIFISVRLGINVISKEYHESIRKYFLCKESIGIIGGIKNLAYYFIGYKNNGNLLYLDPHKKKKCRKFINEIDYNDKYLSKNIHSLNINKMTTALSFGFIFRNFKEYNDLFKFFLINMKSFDYPLFTVTEKDVFDEGINGNLKNLINMEADDF